MTIKKTYNILFCFSILSSFAIASTEITTYDNKNINFTSSTTDINSSLVERLKNADPKEVFSILKKELKTDEEIIKFIETNELYDLIDSADAVMD